jgi:hypothetical protein
MRVASSFKTELMRYTYKRIGVDLLPLANTHFFAPSMQGSWSIKHLLRAIQPSLDYADLVVVRDAGAAQGAYAEAIDATTIATRKPRLLSCTFCCQERFTGIALKLLL